MGGWGAGRGCRWWGTQIGSPSGRETGLRHGTWKRGIGAGGDEAGDKAGRGGGPEPFSEHECDIFVRRVLARRDATNRFSRSLLDTTVQKELILPRNGTGLRS